MQRRRRHEVAIAGFAGFLLEKGPAVLVRGNLETAKIFRH